MTPLFTYNQEQASTVGAGQYVTKSGGFDVKVVRAVTTRSQTQGSQAQFLEMDFETREGQKCNYVSICFVKGDGTQLDFGNKLIQAIMGCAGVQHLTIDQQGNATELLGKSFKAILQRIDFTKNNGQDGYKFELKLPALMTGQTIQEQVSNKEAQAFAIYAGSVEDKDDRKTINSAPQQNSAPQMTPAYDPNGPQSYGTKAGSQQGAQDFDDDIPF
ncbi:hypothetical protein N9878_01055 [bacterium]|nr:hypothetical protein [bacterium]